LATDFRFAPISSEYTKKKVSDICDY